MGVVAPWAGLRVGQRDVRLSPNEPAGEQKHGQRLDEWRPNVVQQNEVAMRTERAAVRKKAAKA